MTPFRLIAAVLLCAQRPATSVQTDLAAASKLRLRFLEELFGADWDTISR